MFKKLEFLKSFLWFSKSEYSVRCMYSFAKSFFGSLTFTPLFQKCSKTVCPVLETRE